MLVGSSFQAHFEVLSDPRSTRNTRYPLMDILFLSLCALLCGAEGFADMEAFGHAKEAWLRQRLALPYGIPSHDTFRRVFALLEPNAFQACFVSWTQAIAACTKGEVIALDGKTLRHSFDQASGQAAMHLVSAWATQNGLALGAEKVADKSNEITAIPVLLARLDIAGCLITCDAMGCQKAIAQQIVEQGADYLLALKDNHPALCRDVENFFDHARKTRFEGVPHSVYESLDKDHGRIETRRCTLVPLAALDGRWQDVQDQWTGLQSLVEVHSLRQIGEKTSVEVRYFLSSLSQSAKQAARAVRAHWGIENGLHYVLDVAFSEDASRIRKDHAPQNLATLRHLALNLIKRGKTTKASIKGSRKRAAWDERFLEALLTN